MKIDSSRPLILVTNDDGYEAAGLHELAQALRPLGTVVVVAPDREQSGAGHALTLIDPLRFREVKPHHYRVNGTPTDCVHLAVSKLGSDRRPDLVVSGINRGLNVGDDVTYSGTVAGALEGTLLHIPSIAVSREIDERGGVEYVTASVFAAEVARRVLDEGLAPGTFLNVNLPARPARGVRITRQGTRQYRAAVEERADPAGRPYYWILPAETVPADEADADHQAIAQGFISITPLMANLTDHSARRALEQWKLEVTEETGS